MGKVVERSAPRKIVSAFLAGALSLAGILSGVSAAPQTAKAAEVVNLAANPGFEESASGWPGWTYEGTEGALTIKTDTPSSGNIRSGSRSASYWSGSDYRFTLSQTVTGLEDGLYTLEAWSSGDKDNKALSLYADGFGGERREAAIRNSGWGISPPTPSNIFA